MSCRTIWAGRDNTFRVGTTLWASSKSQGAREIKNQPEEEEDGSAVADSIYVVIVIHVGLDGIDKTWVKLLSLIKDEQSLGASQHHVPDRFSQLALDTKRRTRLKRQKSLHILNYQIRNGKQNLFFDFQEITSMLCIDFKYKLYLPDMIVARTI